MDKLENLRKRIESELKGTEKDYQEATITEYKEYLFGKIFTYEHILALIARTELNIITQEP